MNRVPPFRPVLMILVALGAAVVGGCGSDDGASSDGSGSGGELVGTQWVLNTEDLGVTGGADVSSFIRFENGKVSGNDGCNQFAGSYEADGSELTFGPLAGTQIACAGAADVVARKVNEALPRVASYSATADSLRLADSGGGTLLTYAASAPGVEGSWEAISVLYDDAIRSVIIGTKLTASFGADGKVSGHAGCNDFSGDYTYGAGKLKIGALAATQRACVEPEGVAEQEQGYLAALESAVKIDQVADGLTLLNAKGQMAVTFTRR